MKTVLALVPLIFLFGCCTPETIKVPVEVKVPVKIPCQIVPPEKPVMPFETSSLGEDLYTKTKKLGAEIRYRKAYELKLEEAIRECNK
jgi:hypothetical protein